MARVLVVDDDDLIKNYIQESLQKKSHEVFLASDGREALELIKKEKFDLILSDIRMPHMNGMELLLNAKLENPYIRFILMSGFHDHQIIPFCLKNNVSRYLEKPFRNKELLETVEESLCEANSLVVRTSNHNMEGWLELDVESSEDSLLRVCQYFRQYLNRFLEKDLTEDILQALFESCQNGIEWGNKMDAGLSLKIGCIYMGEKLLIKIEDQGNGFDINDGFREEQTYAEKRKQRQAEGKRIGGIGTMLTANIMDDFYYNEKGNCVILCKNIGSES